jgi:RNA polymerase primary sigma factor
LLNVAADPHDPVEAILQAGDERETPKRQMDWMDDRERTVLALRYGLDSEPLALREIGNRLGLCGECVRKIESGAIRKLSSNHEEPDALSRHDR